MLQNKPIENTSDSGRRITATSRNADHKQKQGDSLGILGKNPSRIFIEYRSQKGSEHP